MINWKEESATRGKRHKKRATKTWKKIENVTQAVTKVKRPVKNDASQETQRVKPEVLTAKEPTEEEKVDPNVVYRNSVFEIIKNGFSLAYTDGDLKINVDNIYPLLKVLELNPQNDSVLDMVRTACIETFGDIDPKDFDRVVVSLIKLQDEELWKTREAEKQVLAEKRAKRAEMEALKPKVEQPVPETRDEDDDDVVDDDDGGNKMTEDEKKAEQERLEREKEEKEDELYDSIKMAFKFIDSDEDGLISIKDIYNLMFGLGEMLMDEELQDMFKAVDLDNNGRITYDDFKLFLCGPSEAEEETEDVVDSAQPEVEQTPVADEQPEVVAEPSSTQVTKPSNVPEVVTPTAEDEAMRARRRKSLLWGYMTAAANVVAAAERQKVEHVAKVKTPDISEEPEEKENDVQDGTVPVIEISDQPEPEPEVESRSNNTPETEMEPSGQLDAIREEDEHSDYENHRAMPTVPKTEQEKTTKQDAKRKMVSRQSSSASLKNRQESVVAASEGTVADSGFVSFDDSELREHQDVFDFSEDETLGESVELEKYSLRASTIRRSSRSSREELGDDIDRTASETTSRAPSQLTKENLNAVEDDQFFEKTNKARTMQFVNAHMYHEVEHEPTESEIEEEQKTQTRLNRAQYLQKAILRRANTAPALTVSRSKTNTKPKQSVNGMICSHIDIDLTCNSPPKADIRSYRQFSERIRSSKGRRETCTNIESPRRMSIVDMNNSIENGVTAPEDLSKWPMRPLTRPKSGVIRRVLGYPESPIRVVSPSITPGAENAQSRKKLSRPKTAPIYCRSNKYIPSSFTSINGKVSVVASEPFAKSDELYPGKTALTTFHHGFKSIWPTGRQINVLQTKRPFSAFEMNSYSRSIERQDFNIISNRSRPSTPHNSDAILSQGERSEFSKPSLMTSKRPNVIKLELESKQIVRPKIKRASMLVHTSFHSETVR